MVSTAEFTAPPLQADPDEIEHFLQDYVKDDLHLVRIHPELRQAKGRWFGNDLEAALAWAIDWNKQGWNLYWTPNRVRPGLHKKAAKDDVTSARFAHVDSDPPKGVWPWDYRPTARELSELQLPPSFIIHSGGGLQAFWRLEEDAANWPAIEAINIGIRDRFKADSCQSIEHVMRLPGTVNWPDAKKKAAGRVPALARILEPDDGTVYAVHDLAAAFPERKAEKAKSGTRQQKATGGPTPLLTADDLDACPPRLRAMIEEPGTAFAHYDRSRWAVAIACEMIRSGYSEAEILGILLNPLNPGSDHVTDQPDPRRAAQRALAEAGRQEGEPAAANDQWPAPDLSVVQERRLPAPKLPLEVFGAYWAKWISETAEAKSCAPDYVAAGLLTAAGVLIGNSRWPSPWEGWAEPPIIWAAVIGNPSSGKSPGLDASRDLLAAIEAEANEDFPDQIREWETARRVAKIKTEVWESEVRTAAKKGTPPPDRPDGTEEPDRPPRKRIVTADATIEKAARIVQENPRGLLVFRDELAGWIGALDKYGGAGSDRAFYLEGYGGRSFTVDRVKDPVPLIIPSLTVAICGGIQPDRLQSLILSGDDDGLASRFIYVWPDPVPPRRPKSRPHSGAKAKLLQLYQLKSMAPEGERHLLRFAPAAADALQEYRLQTAEAEEGAAGLLLSWQGKLPGMAVRLACILEHLIWAGDSEGAAPPQEVSEWAATAAIYFLDTYATPMALRALGEAALPQAERDAMTLARWIAAADPLPEAINARDLRRKYTPIGQDAARYDAALAELELAGWVRPLPAKPGPGRKPKTYAVNPSLQRRAAA